MTEIGIRALKQNASAVVARAAAGEVIVVTDRGIPVAQLGPLPATRLAALRDTEQARPPKRSLAELPAPGRGGSVTEAVIALRADERAALLKPTTMRSLDSVHFATAPDLGGELDVMVTYDHRLAEAAKAFGLVVVAPV